MEDHTENLPTGCRRANQPSGFVNGIKRLATVLWVGSALTKTSLSVLLMHLMLSLMSAMCRCVKSRAGEVMQEAGDREKKAE